MDKLLKLGALSWVWFGLLLLADTMAASSSISGFTGGRGIIPSGSSGNTGAAGASSGLAPGGPKPPPPDPRFTTCIEVPHPGLFILQKLPGGQALLKHALSQESYTCRSGTTLHYHQKRAFIIEQGEAKWINKIFASSLWEDQQGERFIFDKTTGKATWCRDMQKEVLSHYFPAVAGDPNKTVKVFAFCEPQASGGTLFWALADVFECLGLNSEGKYIRDSLSRSWSAVLARLGCNNSHIVASHKSVQSDRKGLSLHITSCSTASLFILLVHLHNQQKDGEVKGRILVFFKHIMETVAEAGPYDLPVTVAHMRKGSYKEPPSSTMEVAISGNRIDLLGLYKTVEWKGLPSTIRKRWPVAQADTKYDLFSYLCKLLAHQTHCTWLCSQIIFGLARHCEQSWGTLGVPSLTITDTSEVNFRRRKDPNLVKEMLMSARRAKAFLKKGLSLRSQKGLTLRGKQNQYQKQKLANRYWHAARRAFSGSKHLAISLDSTRLGGLNRLFSVMMNLDTGKCACLPPVATSYNIGVHFPQLHNA